MSINSISPVSLRMFVVPIMQARAKPKTEKTKTVRSGKASKSKSVDESLSKLGSELGVNTANDVELDMEAQTSKQFQKKEETGVLYEDPEYDPEFDMAEARYDEARAKPAKQPFTYNPSAVRAGMMSSVGTSGIKDNYSGLKRVISDDRFTYFTLIEAILIYNILYEQLPEGSLKFSFGTKKVFKAAKSIEVHLAIYKKKEVFKKYKIIYDIERSFFDIFDFLTNQKVGEVDFDLVGQENYVEEATGSIEGKTLNLDPVWDKDNPSCIKYQTLKIGHRILDLTSTSKDSREGQWSFKGLEQPVGYQMIFCAYETKEDHVLTTKRIRIGKSELQLDLRFLDDCFPEPYDGDGVIKFKKL
jgi:hypothetical protein